MNPNETERQTVDEATTLTPADFATCRGEVDLPIGRFVRIEGNDALFIVEEKESCASCALDPDVFDDPPFPCDAFACRECDRRDETSVILRRVEGSEGAANEPEARRQ